MSSSPSPPPALAEFDDATLAARAKDGDVAAYETLVDRYQGPVFRLALRMLGDRSDAEDITQESLIVAWRRLDQLREPELFRSWLYRGAARRCLDQLRQRDRRDADSLDEADGGGRTLLDVEPDATTDRPEAAAVRSAEWDALAKCVEQLPPLQRACWLLRELDDFSYADIARVLRTTEAGVRGQLARARARLTKEMAEWR